MHSVKWNLDFPEIPGVSIRITAAVWKATSYRDKRLLVLLALADWANDEGICWPSFDAIARKARTTRRGAIKIIQHFIHDDVIEIRKHGLGRGNATTYRIKGELGRWSVAERTAEQKGERHSPFSCANGEQTNGEMVNAKTQNGE